MVLLRAIPDLRASQLNSQRENLPYGGRTFTGFIFAHESRSVSLFQEFTPNTGMGNWQVDQPG
jgi:hypothetical protein